MKIAVLGGCDSREAIQEQTHIEAKKDVKQETKLVGRIRKVPGLILYSFNFETSELKEIPIVKTQAIKLEDQKPVEKDKAMFDPKCTYFQCHNLRAAIKKVNKFAFTRIGVKDYLIIEKKLAVINPKYVSKESKE